jgi:hypothetical protein
LWIWDPWDYNHFHRTGVGTPHGNRLKSSHGKPSRNLVALFRKRLNRSY